MSISFLTRPTTEDVVGRVWEALRTVRDPELDNDVVSLDFVATLEASASMPRLETGEPVRVEWVIVAVYTFDLTTLKVVREVTFSDDEALQTSLVELGVAKGAPRSVG